MNLIVYNQNELLSNSLLILNGERGAHLRKVLKVTPGSVLRVGEINGCLGQGVVREVSDSEVKLEIELSGQTSEAPWVDLVLAVPRPIILKRVLSAIASLGVGRLLLVASARVEKSYFASPVLAEDKLEHYLRLGLEQGGITQLPEVKIIKRFNAVADEVQSINPGVRLLAHPDTTNSILDCEVGKGSSSNLPLLAIGPEGGWIPKEISAFEASGFYPFSLGPRILRVDTAVPVILGQLDLLRQLRTRERC